MPMRKVLFTILLLLILPVFAAAKELGEINSFFVDKDYSLEEREKVFAILEKRTEKAYFFVEKDWMENLSEEKRGELNKKLEEYAREFDETIYPVVTGFYGEEWRPGVDSDERITILCYETKKGVAGYFSERNEFESVQNPKSNEKEMFYLNVDYIFFDIFKDYLTHEFVHLITFNQKNRLRGISEKVWLNEARAEYAPTLLSYNEREGENNLSNRIKNFLRNPSNSLTAWEGKSVDYGVINMFFHYIADFYGDGVFANSIKTKSAGLKSLEEGLFKNGIKKDIREIFAEWAIAVFLNDRETGDYYGYKSEKLKDINVAPSLIFLSSGEKINKNLTYFVEPWAGNWYRILGGEEGDLSVKIKMEKPKSFFVNFVLCGEENGCQIEKAKINEGEEGIAEIEIENFGEKWFSLTLIPLYLPGEEVKEAEKFDISISMENNYKEKEEIEALKKQIEELKNKIKEVKEKIEAILRERGETVRFSGNLYFGMKGEEVEKLQIFLRNRGEGIYPEEIISGYFGSLTKAAVIRFQEKYASEVLSPWGLKSGTGFVGEMTREKINNLLD